jgi:HAD superfamily hydrolase (TIGR01549 family)
MTGMEGGGPTQRPAAILDVDGTLVDTNYHHALAWYRALRSTGRVVPLWRLHRHMGMGGDQLVASVTDDEFEREHGDEARDREKAEYQKLIDDTEPLPGALDLLAALHERGCRVILASSAKQEEIEHYLEQLDATDMPHTTSADVEATKPEPDLVLAALEKAGGHPAVMIGDSVYDCEAAGKAGVRCFALLTGGFSEEELRESGAEDVFESLADLIAALDSVLGSVTETG